MMIEMTSSLPRDQGGLDWCLIVYFDVLGMRQRFKTGTRQALQDLFIVPDAVYRSALGTFRNVGLDPLIRTFHFQDAYVRATEIGWFESPDAEVLKYQRSRLLKEVESMSMITIDCMRAGLLIRGALSIGGVAFEDGRVTGPGIVSAVELEHSARFPRLVLSESVTDLSNKCPAGPAYNFPFLRDDGHGVRFVDYLRWYWSQTIKPDPLIELVAEHQCWLSTAWAAADTKDVRDKLTWLIEYHNGVVDQILRYFEVRGGEGPKCLYLNSATDYRIPSCGEEFHDRKRSEAAKWIESFRNRYLADL